MILQISSKRVAGTIPRLWNKNIHTSSILNGERFGVADGSSGWKWEKGGVGMGGKEAGKACEERLQDGNYKTKEYFSYDRYSYFDFEKSMLKNRLPQPDSNLTKFW